VSGPVTVGITARREDDLLVLEVLDSGPGLRVTPMPDGIGLRNTRERLRHLYGERGTLELYSASGAPGAIARVTVPLPPLPRSGEGAGG
jgi:signal transduction histidine kinase